MSEDKYVIQFTDSHSLPGGPGYNNGESACFSKAEADQIVKLKRGTVIRIVPASTSKAPSSPPKNKMVEEPVRKKARQRLTV